MSLKAYYKLMKVRNLIFMANNSPSVTQVWSMSLLFIHDEWTKVKNFQNPELEKFKFLNLQDAYKTNNFMFKWLIVLR